MMMCIYLFTVYTKSYIYVCTKVSSIVMANSKLSSELTFKIFKLSSELIYDHVYTFMYHIYKLIYLYIYNSQLYRDCM